MSYLAPGSATDFTPVPDKLDVPWYVGLSHTSSSTIRQKPSPVSTLNVGLYGNSAQLTWTAASGADGYVVQSRANVESEFQTHGVTTGLAYTIFGLDPTMIYWFRITSYNKSGYSFHVETSAIPTVTDPSSVKIMLFAGQSNMQGQGETYSASLDTSPPNVIQYCIGDSYSQVRKTRPGLFARAAEPMDDGGSNINGAIGPCLSFARSYMAANPTHTLVLVNVAVSGSGFSIEPNWTAGTGSLYQRALSTMNTVNRTYPTAELIGIGYSR